MTLRTAVEMICGIVIETQCLKQMEKHAAVVHHLIIVDAANSVLLSV